MNEKTSLLLKKITTVFILIGIGVYIGEFPEWLPHRAQLRYSWDLFYFPIMALIATLFIQKENRAIKILTYTLLGILIFHILNWFVFWEINPPSCIGCMTSDTIIDYAIAYFSYTFFVGIILYITQLIFKEKSTGSEIRLILISQLAPPFFMIGIIFLLLFLAQAI